MGEAKNRGTFQQRVAQSVEAKQRLSDSLGLVRRSLDDIREELGLPEDSTFHGYVVHRPQDDEFLVRFATQPHATARDWCKGPQWAHRFEDFADAYRLAREPDEIVVGLFETETQFFVAEVL